MSPAMPHEAQALYRDLQRELAAAVDRCADGLGSQALRSPSTPEGEALTLESLLRSMLRGEDYPRLGQRLLMLLGEAARRGDAVALFTIERMAVHYAAHEVEALIDAGHFGEPVLAARDVA